VVITSLGSCVVDSKLPLQITSQHRNSTRIAELGNAAPGYQRIGMEVPECGTGKHFACFVDQCFLGLQWVVYIQLWLSFVSSVHWNCVHALTPDYHDSKDYCTAPANRACASVGVLTSTVFACTCWHRCQFRCCTVRASGVICCCTVVRG